MDGKDEAFQTLKPPAVALSQAVLTINSTQRDTRVVEDRLSTLQAVLSTIIASGSYFDGKLADYVFFPVSQVLKFSQKASIRSLELSLAIISVLIQRGWGTSIQQPLAQQLLILCTLLAGDKPSIASTDQTTPELQQNAIRCLAELFAVLGKSSTGTAFLTSDAHVPQLGHTVSTLLQAIHQNATPSVQEAAIKTLQSLFCIDLPSQILLNFLPGVVSTLTKVLTAPSGQRRRPEVLCTSLEILSSLFKSCFQDNISLDATINNPKDLAAKTEDESIKVAATQIRLALVNISRLRDHDRSDVKAALGRLCMAILRHCRKTLNNCTEPALETILTLLAGSHMTELHFEVVMLMTTDPSMVVTVQSTLFDWSQSLVRIMQAGNQEAKIQRLEQIGSAYQCLIDVGPDLTTTTELLVQGLKDCVVVTLQNTRSKTPSDKALATVNPLQTVVTGNQMARLQDFASITTSPAESAVVTSIRSVVELIADADGSSDVVEQLLSSLTTSREQNLVANFWLSLQFLRRSLMRNSDLDAFIDVGSESATLSDRIEEVYAFALAYLTAPSDEQMPVVSSLALQALAIRAQSAGIEFKIELIDALYPVLHSLATPHEVVQHDSMVVLNTFTKSCGYTSVADLIVDNVDYLTNAVSLKLNSFDISPQAPQVLLMMVQLAGPSLVPYLEDIIESIFAALEDYHGYPLLVELLFKTLAVVAQEGSKAPLLDARNDVPLLLVHRGASSWKSTTVEDLVQSIRARAVSSTAEPQTAREAAPHRPWGDKDDKEAVEEAQPAAEEEVAPPAPKTYNILVKITELTQHFLPSASPALRISLLSLIRTTVPAIARHENTFLPLINTLWPEIVSRLDDEEPAIRTAALQIIAILCEHAKDFMRSRIIDLWPHLREIWRTVVRDITQSVSHNKSRATPSAETALVRLTDQAKRDIQRMQAASAEYSNVSARMMWQAIVQLLTVIVRSVPINPDMFDEALEMLASELDDQEVIAAFEQENADALWLARLKQGKGTVSWQPGTSKGFVKVY